MTDTFFDLQRFAVLVGGQSSFIWKDGELFGAAGASAAVGTSSNPAYLVTKDGVAEAGTGTDVYLSGEKSYSFSLQGKNGWEAKLGKDNVAHVTNGEEGLALASLTGSDAAVLTITGEFAENIGADVTTTAETKASLAAAGTLTFGKAVEGATINLKAGEIAVLNKGGNDVVLNNEASFAVDIAKKAKLTSSDGAVAQIVTGNNSITLSNGDIVEVKADKDTNATISSDQFLGGAKSITFKTATGFPVPTNINGVVWNEISGGLSSITFDSVGSAKIENTGAVVVNGQAGAIATVQNLDTAGATVNGVKVAMTALNEAESANVAFALENGGVSSVDVSKALGQNLIVTGDQLFIVKAGKAEHVVSTDANAVTFNATGSQINVAVEKDKSYAAAGGGNVQFLFAENATNVSLNNTTVQLGTAEGVTATASDATAGIDNLNGLDVGSKVSVAGDSDGFVAAFDSVEGAGEVVFEVNNASIRAANIDGQQIQISINGAGTDALITGMSNTENVSVGGTGITYHFKDATSDNAISASEAVYVTLNSSGAVADSMDDLNYKKLKENDEGKWNNVASIGNDQYLPEEGTGDTVVANRSDVYEEFYNLGNSEAGQATLAVFANEDATVSGTVANPNGVTFTGADPTKPLAENGHVTLTAGAAVGAAPINIQRNESDAVVDVVVDLRNAVLPSTVAVGTLDSVSASHEIHLSNAGTGYVNVGALATGQNKIFAGTGGAQIRHDGERATIVGNSGIDTIWAGKYDIVRGDTGADRFYDSADYTITDYDATTGDALIATRLHGVDDITKANIKYNYDAGNEVSFGTSRNSFTLGQDQNASLNMNVAIMDTDARVVGSRNVVLAGRNGGAVDASALTNGALIIADESRNNNSGDNIIGSAYADEIYVGANDIVNGGAGNDSITIGGISVGDAGATVAIGEGKNTVSGWSFGFNANAGNSQLIAGEGFVGSFDNDRLLVTDANGSMLFDDSAKTSYHGEYDVIVNGIKYMAIRTNDDNNTNTRSYGDVVSNDDLADIYIAEREGILRFESGVTENLGTVELGSNEFKNITYLSLGNNSKAVVYGTDERETVDLGGDAAVGAQKAVSLGGGNDVIYSSGDDSLSAGHELYFGTEDGRDTIRGFGHYLGVDVDPDVQYADTLVLEKFGGLYTGTGEDGGTRVEFVTEGDNRVFLYEANGISTENMYRIKVGAFDTKLAKIGNSGTSNLFAFDEKVDYYVGSSAENAQDTLTIGNEYGNVNVWLDGSNGTDHTSADEHYFRGITYIDASAEANTNVSLAGAGGNDTLIAGGEGTYNYLWGGAGDNVLYGSENSNQDYFFYVRNAGAYLQTVDDDVTGGHDEIYNYDFENNDVIWLGDTTLDDIKSTDIGDTAVTIEFKNGGSLTVNSTDNVRVRLNEGLECYIADRETKTWSHE